MTAPAHTHVFRLIGGQTTCADPACLTPIAALATPGCDTFCDGPCAYCDARDLGRMRTHRRTCGKCDDQRVPCDRCTDGTNGYGSKCVACSGSRRTLCECTLPWWSADR